MNLSHLVGKRIVSAWTVPSCEILFLVDDRQQLYEFLPGDIAKRTDAIRCFISVEGSKAFHDGVIEKAGTASVISQPVGRKWASVSESIIVTNKGACRIATGVFNAKEHETCPLTVKPVKGFPPQESIYLADFARAFKEERNDATGHLREERVQGVQAIFSSTARGRVCSIR